MNVKILPVLTICLLIFTGFNVLADGEVSNQAFEILSNSSKVYFSESSIYTSGEFLSVNLEESDSFLLKTGKPVLPQVVKQFTFPHRTKIIDIKCTFSGFTEEKIENKIKPSPKPIPKISIEKTVDFDEQPVFDVDVYSSSEPYPTTWYDYSVTRGINGITVSVHLYPIRYKPADDILLKASDAEITINYEKLLIETTYLEEYDMVIIAPEEFKSLLQPLIDHKNDVGVSTYLKTTEEIFDEYTGRDEAEKVKYFIKDALDTHNITYVLLVGGMKGIQREWYVPVRRTNLDDDWETGYLSDLYFADIYDGENNFSSWDSNENDVFAEWIGVYSEDIIDGVPDVSVGRLACRSKKEVKTVVDKIITYETVKHYSFWSNKMIAVAGDSAPEFGGSDYYEGEMVADASTDLMEQAGFRIQKLYTSYLTFRNPRNVIRPFRFGAAFVHFEGHGNPSDWGTHYPEDNSYFVDGLNVFQMPFLFNGKRLPIVVVGGCHNSQFNVTPLNIVDGLKREGANYFKGRPPHNNGSFWLNDWVKECWGWRLLSVKNGGAIATIGNTGIGYGGVAEEAADYLEGWINIKFFEIVANQENTTVGFAHSQAINEYIQVFGINDNGGSDSGKLDRKTVDEWVLLGDPSLKIGGYA